MRAQDISTAATSGFGAEMCASECVTQLIACQDNPMLAAQHDQIAQLVSPTATDYSYCPLGAQGSSAVVMVVN